MSQDINTEIEKFFKIEDAIDSEEIEFLVDMQNFYKNNPTEWEKFKQILRENFWK